jgi:hypothetical protein
MAKREHAIDATSGLIFQANMAEAAILNNMHAEKDRIGWKAARGF